MGWEMIEEREALKEFEIGYTQGVFDMFHIGHLNLLNRAKERCEKLIVGVNSDALVQVYKKKQTIIQEEERREIVANIKAVDACFLVDTLDKVTLWKRFGFQAVFIGDDWKGNERWAQTERDLAVYGAKVIYLPHTRGISSTGLRPEHDNRVHES